MDEIKGLLKRGGKCYKILVGHIKDQRKETVALDKLKQPNAINIKTLGGNHTRQALQELANENPTHKETYEYIMCTVYAGLSDKDALRLGYEHNKCNEVGKPTSTEDFLRLFRRELLRAIGYDEDPPIQILIMRC